MILRNEIWWADLGHPRGSEPGRRRPVLVVSADAWNRSRIATVTCLTVTTTIRLADAPGNVMLPAGAGGLDEDSVANVSQVVTIHRSLLTERIGELPTELVRQVDAGLRRALELTAN